MAPFYSVKIYIKEFEKMLKKLLTKENTHDIISELLLKKVSNNEP